jgi:hypothetical protein
VAASLIGAGLAVGLIWSIFSIAFASPPVAAQPTERQGSASEQTF